MIVRRATGWIATVVVAVLVALAVPVAQLQTRWVETTCCCPDPTHCHCPDHKAPVPGQPSMGACHRAEHTAVAPQLSAFAVPVVAIALAPVRAAVAIAVAIPAPHAAPPPIRPDAPS
ncbi:MAG TPA: hypothetical protein VFT22_27120 [Kofleriaceae bacterium]|nr:hypothetical protein [Kofleriaceae bacterium]